MFNTADKATNRLAAGLKCITLRDSLSLHKTVPPLADGESGGTGRYQAVVQIVLNSGSRGDTVNLSHKG